MSRLGFFCRKCYQGLLAFAMVVGLGMPVLADSMELFDSIDVFDDGAILLADTHNGLPGTRQDPPPDPSVVPRVRVRTGSSIVNSLTPDEKEQARLDAAAAANLVDRAGEIAPDVAESVGTNTGFLASMIRQFEEAANDFLPVVVQFARWFFFSLLLIEFVMTFGAMALKGSDIGEYALELVKRIILVAFALWLLENPLFLIEIMMGLWDIGYIARDEDHVVQQTLTITPFISIVYEMAGTIMDLAKDPVEGKQGWWEQLKGLPRAIGNIIIGFVLVIMMLYALWAIIIQLILTMCEMYVVFAAGLISLGFWSFSPTKVYFDRYLGGLVGTGVKLLTIEFVIGVAIKIMEQTKKQFIAAETWPEILAISAMIIPCFWLLKELANKIPNYMQGLIGGSISSGTSPESIAKAGIAAAGLAAAAPVAAPIIGGGLVKAAVSSGAMMSKVPGAVSGGKGAAGAVAGALGGGALAKLAGGAAGVMAGGALGAAHAAAGVSRAVGATASAMMNPDGMKAGMNEVSAAIDKAGATPQKDIDGGSGADSMPDRQPAPAGAESSATGGGNPGGGDSATVGGDTVSVSPDGGHGQTDSPTVSGEASANSPQQSPESQARSKQARAGGGGEGDVWDTGTGAGSGTAGAVFGANPMDSRPDDFWGGR